MYDYIALENFWKRYNKAMLDKVSLDKERSELMAQNQQLRMLLKQYLDGISVNDDILTQANPLLIVNHKTNVKYVTLCHVCLLYLVTFYLLVVSVSVCNRPILCGVLFWESELICTNVPLLNVYVYCV